MIGKIGYSKGVKNIAFIEKEVPKPEKGELVVKIRLCNICGSDMHGWAGSGGLASGCLGHEFVGEIYELGEGVEKDYAGNPVKVGDRIVAPYYLTCMKCSTCAEGDFQYCENAYAHLAPDPNEWPYFGGAFSTHYYIRSNQFFYKVPDDLDDKLVVGANCAFSQSYCGLDVLGLKFGEILLIQGAGGLGLYAACIAKEIGATVIIIDGVKERLELAKRFGADYAIDMNEYPSVEDRLKVTLDLTNGKGVDRAIELTGYTPAFEEGLRHLKIKGQYVICGINVVGKEATMSPGYITRKAITVHGVARYMPHYLHKSLLFLQKYQDKYPFTEMSDQVYPLEDIQSVMEQVYDHKIARAVLKP